MKILYFNVTVGCKEAARYKGLVNFIRKQKPDVLGLSELNGWNRDNFAKLNKFKAQTGLRYSLFCESPHGYHIALLSRTPLQREYVSRKGIWHGVIIAAVRVRGKHYSFALTHLSPISEEFRLNDLKQIFAKLKANKHAILMGDMNSISPQDHIDEKTLLLRARKLQIKKFGTEGIEKAVISSILRRGMLDVSHIKEPKSRVYSVPTGYIHDPRHFAHLHLDYIFVTKDLKSKVKRAGVLKNRETDALSDHYPVFAQL